MLQHVKLVEHNLSALQDGADRVQIRLVHIGADAFDSGTLPRVQAHGQQRGQAGLCAVQRKAARRPAFVRGKESHDIRTARSTGDQRQTRLAYRLSRLDFLVADCRSRRRPACNADQWRTPLYAGSAAERDRLTLLGKLRHRAGSRRVVGFAGLPNCALKSTKSLNSIGSVATPSSRDIASSCAQLLLEHNGKAYDSKLIVRAPTATSIPNSGRCEPRTSAAAIGPCALDSKRLGSRSL